VVIVGSLGVFSLLFGAGLVTLSVREYLRGRTSAAWPTTAGVITATHIKEARRGLRVRYTPVVHYRYEVGGVGHETDRLALDQDLGGASPAAAAELLKPYQVGSAVQVHYDPGRPDYSVLRVGASARWLLGALALAVFFILLGAAAVYVVVVG
jgi:Protein of unknown function (DUF3592)